ncbi:hypothetical protein ACWCPF_15675 [Streptomyces sp. NPDC001858]
MCAYNDWHIDEWCGAYPGRFIPMALQAACDTGTVLSVHIGCSGRLAIPAVDSPSDVMITLQPINLVQAAADLLRSRT